ncbi:sulfotransferase domain-containing protein, partial [Candidatus Pelagibacter sp.]|nr:sulfotransferase domain-containing protein [Candidatus Pelagibacter sp.]
SGIKKHYSKLGEDNIILLSSMINRAKLDFKFIYLNKKIYGDQNYLVIKYEDLIKKTDKCMKKISKFLKVKYSNEMLFSSIFNIKTKSNTFTKNKTIKINRKSLARWKNELSQKEKSIINFFFKNELKKFYQIDTSKEFEYEHISDFYSLTNKRFFFNDSFR